MKQCNICTYYNVSYKINQCLPNGEYYSPTWYQSVDRVGRFGDRFGQDVALTLFFRFA